MFLILWRESIIFNVIVRFMAQKLRRESWISRMFTAS